MPPDPSAVIQPEGTQPRLLAVDDDAASAELIVRVAERSGFQAFATSDSRGVISLAAMLKPDILAIDICMPNVDALALVALLAGAGFTGRLLIVSGEAESVLREAADAAVRHGLSRPHTFRKPIDLKALRAVLMEAPAAALAS